MKREERRGTQPDLDILIRKEATLINNIYDDCILTWLNST